MNIRIGHGFDVHAFAANRPLLLGGIRIEHEKGLLGHSDADVVLHALTDAILGATAQGDIGQWFPDTDEQYKDADSALLLSKVWASVRGDAWQLINCDIVIMAQRPKLASSILPMRTRIAELLEVGIDRVGIKATTTERLGFVGREEGIACSAVCLLERNDS